MLREFFGGTNLENASSLFFVKLKFETALPFSLVFIIIDRHSHYHVSVRGYITPPAPVPALIPQ